jgi:hypothetical protein
MFLRGVSGTPLPIEPISYWQDPNKDQRSALRVGGNFGNKVGSYQASRFGDHRHGTSTGVANGTLTARAYVSSANNVHIDHRDIPIWSANLYAAGGSAVTPGSSISRGAVIVGATDLSGATESGETRPNNAYVYYIIKH